MLDRKSSTSYLFVFRNLLHGVCLGFVHQSRWFVSFSWSGFCKPLVYESKLSFLFCYFTLNYIFLVQWRFSIILGFISVWRFSLVPNLWQMNCFTTIITDWVSGWDIQPLASPMITSRATIFSNHAVSWC